MRQAGIVWPIRENARILLASVVGTIVEYYDFYVFGYAAALVFGPLFFPSHAPATQSLFSLMTFGIAFVARPLGGVVFGHFGDRVGRKATLVASLLLMGVCTLTIAFLPTYLMVGWLAPALLCALRFGQGLGLGGEWAGAALLSIENAPPGWRARFGAAPPLGATLGNIAANAVFLLMGVGLSNADFMAWGWRLPFIASALLVVFGLWVRLKISETPEFRAALVREAPSRVPVLRLLAEHSVAVLAGCAAVVAFFALVYMPNTYALAQATGPLGYDRATFLMVQLLALLGAVPVLILAAHWADRSRATTTIAAGALATVAVGFIFGPGLQSGSLQVAGATLFASDVAWALVGAGFSTWLAQLYHVNVRYSGFALAFNTGGILGGAIVPVFAQMMSASGAGVYVGLLLSVAGLLALVAVRLARPLPGAELERLPPPGDGLRLVRRVAVKTLDIDASQIAALPERGTVRMRVWRRLVELAHWGRLNPRWFQL
jgi:MFS family permease